MERGKLVRMGAALVCGLAAVVLATGMFAGAAPQPGAGMAAIVAASALAEPDPGPDPGPAMLRSSYTWTGNVSSYWNVSGNWTGGGPGGTYPSSAADDATFEGFAPVTLDNSHTIDDLNCIPNSTVLLDADESDYTLTCDTVTITGDTSGAELKLVDRAGIETN